MKNSKTAENEPEDHRVRVGAARRNKTRLLLLESALGVLHDKGPDAAVIEDFIAAAGVSRGTFYNYFDTVSELLLALATEMSNEVLATVDPIVLTCSTPVERFSTGTRLYMQMATRYPLWGSFLNRVGTRIATRGQLIEKYLTRDLSEALSAGLIKVDNVLVARDMVLGSIFYGIETMVTEPTHADHSEQLMRSILRGLCVPDKVADDVAYAPLQKIESIEGPIFSRLKQNAPKVTTIKPSKKVAPSGKANAKALNKKAA
jgi:AcrR family transcriptional regulator